VILAFDVTNRETYNHIVDWMKECKESCPKTAVLYLVGNKKDLRSQYVLIIKIRDLGQVRTEEATEFAETHGLKYIETSAKTAENINEVFTYSYLAVCTICKRDNK
jgi:GTPase SAR1 family protein